MKLNVLIDVIFPAFIPTFLPPSEVSLFANTVRIDFLSEFERIETGWRTGKSHSIEMNFLSSAE